MGACSTQVLACSPYHAPVHVPVIVVAGAVQEACLGDDAIAVLVEQPEGFSRTDVLSMFQVFDDLLSRLASSAISLERRAASR